MTTILPEPDAPDPAAAALDLFTKLPGIAGAPAVLPVFQDLAGIMQLEGILDGMDWNDARATIAALGVDRLVPFPPSTPDGVDRTIESAVLAIAALQ